jgi:hypothetical protein
LDAITAVDDNIMLNLTKQQVEHLPAFDSDHHR